MTAPLHFQTQATPDPIAIRRQAETLALVAIDSLRQVAPEIAPVFETGGARELIVEQYEQILTTGQVRWEGRL
jgi:hypothetical protein